MVKIFSPTHKHDSFYGRLRRDVLGICLFIATLFCGLSFYSYSPTDASLNVASDALQNLGGAWGAHISDIAFQFFGFPVWSLIPATFIWSFRLFQRAPFSLILRILGLFCALVFFSASISSFLIEDFSLDSLPTPQSWDGSSGLILMEFVYQQFMAFKLMPPFWVLGTLFFLLGVAFYVPSLSLPLTSWKRGFQAIQDFMRMVLKPFVWLFSYFSGRGSRSREQLRFYESFDAAHQHDSVEKDGHALRTRVSPKLTEADSEKTEATIHAPAQARKSGASVVTASGPKEDGLYDFPPVELLGLPKRDGKGPTQSPQELKERGQELESVLEEFGIRGEIQKIRPGPVVTLYELTPAPGIKSSRIIGLADDIARSMSAISTRVAVIPGQNALGIELPNEKRETVYLRELFEHESFDRSTNRLTLALGKDIGGSPIAVDLARMPHLLVAGTTGSGKSVAINTMILSLLYRLSPDRCKFIMIDPKMLELSIYEGIPHLLAPVVTEPKKAVVALKWTVREMEERYRGMSKLGVRNIDGYNMRVEEAKAKGEVITRRVQTGFDSETGKPIFEEQPLNLEPLPYIVVVVDEMADLMLVAGKEIEATIQRLAQMARAAGIHIIMATQRPSVDVITGTIKANFPTRISFQVTSKIDSRTILSEQGAEQLLGQGDMLYMAAGGRITRIHGPFVRDEEVEKIVSYLRAQGTPSYLDEITADDEDAPQNFDEDSGGGDGLYNQAVDLVLREGKASTSFIQRHLQIGYNRAARIIDKMEADGVISAANHVGKREIIGRGR